MLTARGHALRHFFYPWGGLERVVHDLANDGEDPVDRKVSYTYDENGNVTSTRDPALLAGAPLETFYDANLSPQYPAGSNKCSGFTCAAAASAGADTTVTVPDGKGGTKTRCPTAAELGRGNVPDWRLLGAGESPEAGDIMADPFPGGTAGATGHAAVVVPDGSGGTTTQGAHADRVGPPGANYPTNPRYRRYTGD